MRSERHVRADAAGAGRFDLDLRRDTYDRIVRRERRLVLRPHRRFIGQRDDVQVLHHRPSRAWQAYGLGLDGSHALTMDQLEVLNWLEEIVSATNLDDFALPVEDPTSASEVTFTPFGGWQVRGRAVVVLLAGAVQYRAVVA